MKIAKKVLAAVMAVAMIFALSVMAFADSGSIVATAGAVSDKGVVEITITAKDAIGLKSFDLTITGPEGFTPVKVAEGPMAGAAKDADNAITTEFNKAEGKFSGYFKQNLMDKAGWEAAAEEMLAELPAEFDPANFVLGVLSAKVDSAKLPMTVTVTGNVKSENGDFTVNVTVPVGGSSEPEPTTAAPVVEPTTAPKADEPTTAAPVVEPTTAPKADEPTTKASEEPTTKAGEEEPASEQVTAEQPSNGVEPGDGDGKDGKGNEKTGDNMALAAAVGVVVLAGAAFVITKKRK